MIDVEEEVRARLEGVTKLLTAALNGEIAVGDAIDGSLRMLEYADQWARR